MSRNCIVSVATYSYLSRAIVMADTFAERNRDCNIFLLIPDMTQAQVDSTKWPTGSSTRLLGFDALNNPLVHAMQKYFDAFELCCALKSFLLHQVLFDDEYDKALVLDPDIMCYASFDGIWSDLENTDIILTPHTNSPMPQDGEVPNDLEFVYSGFINGGFMAAKRSQGTENCLEWIIRKVSDFGFFVPKLHAYADQTWMSCLPWFFPENVSVARHAGLNVAYWNFHERRLTIKDEDYFCNDQRLIFLHYSGFDLKQPKQLTKHSERTFCPDTNAILPAILSEYAAWLRSVGAQIPQLVPDLPCSQLPLKKRLKLFEILRGKAASISFFNNYFAGSFFKIARSAILRFRKLIKA